MLKRTGPKLQIQEGLMSDMGPHLHLMVLWQIFQVTLQPSAFPGEERGSEGVKMVSI